MQTHTTQLDRLTPSSLIECFNLSHAHSVDEGGSQELFEGEESEGGPGHVLWVDKYSPHGYTDLLSDDVRLPLYSVHV